MTKKEWSIAAVEILVMTILVLPAWVVLGTVLIGPAAGLKAISSRFSIANQQRIDAVYAFSREIFSILAMIGNTLTYRFRSHEVLEGNGTPILLVHGYLHNPSGWSAYLKRLKQEGLGPVYTLHLTHPFLSIRDYAEQVKQKAEEIEAKTQRKELALIGHSMGGVVSAFYASKLAPKGAVSHVITLGSPLHGSCLAKFFAVGPNGREMRVGSPLLQELREAIALKEGDIQFYHAGSAADELVPASSALLWRNPKRELRVSDLGHASLMTSQKVADWVCACLRSSA